MLTSHDEIFKLPPTPPNIFYKDYITGINIFISFRIWSPRKKGHNVQGKQLNME